jgi:hypothetical protein
MKKYLILALALLINSLNAQEMNVKINDKEYQVYQYDEAGFQERFSSSELTNNNTVSSGGVVRTFVNSKGDYILEYFSKKYLHFRSLEDYESMKGVYFPTLIPYGYNNRITYYILIKQEEFDELSKGLDKYPLPSELEDMGNFFKFPDGRVLFEGKKYWAKGDFYILENLETLLAMDDELFPLVEEAITLTGYDRESVETVTVPKYELEILNGVLQNHEEARAILAEILNVDFEDLNFSEKSLQLIDMSLFENMNRIDPYELESLCTAYVSECIRRYFNDPSLTLKHEEGETEIVRGRKKSDLRYYVVQHVIDIDYGMAAFEPVYFGVLNEIK